MKHERTICERTNEGPTDLPTDRPTADRLAERPNEQTDGRANPTNQVTRPT